jgi:O-antigen/teichoic acid export membrane protein
MTNPVRTLDAAPLAHSIRRRLARGSSIYGLTTFGLRTLGFALLGVYSRYFTPRDYGIVSLAESIGLVVGIIAGLALESGSRRLYFQFVGDEERLRSYLSTVLRLAAAASAVALVISYLLGPLFISRLAPNWNVSFFPYLALAIFTAIASQLFQCRLVIYQCQERLSAHTALVVLQSLSTTLCTFGLVVWTRHGATGLLAARALGAAIALLVAVVLSVPTLRAKPNAADLRETLRISLPLVPHGLLAVGLVAIDRFILQHYRPLSEVGLYTLAYNIGMIMTMITASLSRAWAPLFYSLLLNGEKGRRVAGGIFDEIAVLLLLMASAGILLAPFAVRGLFDSHYWPAARLAPIILAAYLCHSLFVLFQLAIIQAQRTPLVSMVSGTAFLANVALNFAWVPRHGMVGAAYATLAAYFVELVLIAILAHRVLPLPHRWIWPSMTLLVFAAALVCAQLQTAMIPTLLFAGLLITTCAIRLIHYFRTRPLESPPEPCGPVTQEVGLETF